MKMKKVILAVAVTLASVVVALPAAQAACAIPDKFVHDMVVNDVVHYALGDDSLSAEVVGRMGYDSYDEYMYSEDSHSKGIASLIDGERSSGGKLSKAIYKNMEHKTAAIKKADVKLKAECSTKDLAEKLFPVLLKALNGKDVMIELDLMDLYMKGLVGTLKR
ncbi:MAG: hypothetical protein M0Q29_09455 [Thiopseudomonas sp.]|nr:hypothetical protein [Thiopseudomonas sp.]